MGQSPPKVIIKKYENRRLYDTLHSRYVNVDDVARLIREGADVQVIDAKSGEDRTRTVLSQIVLEGAKDRDLSLPLELLRQLVQATDSAGRQLLEWYLTNAMNTYQKISSSLIGTLATPPPTPAQSDANKEIEALHRRLEELEKRLTNQKHPVKAARKRARKAASPKGSA